MIGSLVAPKYATVQVYETSSHVLNDQIGLVDRPTIGIIISESTMVSDWGEGYETWLLVAFPHIIGYVFAPLVSEV